MAIFRHHHVGDDAGSLDEEALVQTSGHLAVKKM